MTLTMTVIMKIKVLELCCYMYFPSREDHTLYPADPESGWLFPCSHGYSAPL